MPHTTNIVYSGVVPEETPREALIRTLENWRRWTCLPPFFEVMVDYQNCSLRLLLLQQSTDPAYKHQLLLNQLISLSELFDCVRRHVSLTGYPGPEGVLLSINLTNVTWP